MSQFHSGSTSLTIEIYPDEGVLAEVSIDQDDLTLVFNVENHKPYLKKVLDQMIALRSDAQAPDIWLKPLLVTCEKRHSDLVPEEHWLDWWVGVISSGMYSQTKRTSDQINEIIDVLQQYQDWVDEPAEGETTS